MNFVGKVTSLLFNRLSRLVIAFLPRSQYLLISWLQSPSTVILEPKKIKPVTDSIFSPCIFHEVMGLVANQTQLVECWVLSQHFPLPSFTLIKKLSSFSSLFAVRRVSSVNLRLLIFLPEILIPVCDSFSLAFLMMYSSYKLNKQGDNMQP